ncbi:maleylpyruvate isomerase family mycothiol-dependent enzyme [Microlunatus aurantiacus]|uniref:Maleylpyruvate isomerase family mycothiol-dependent enzyme n=1 Tax=Microlunatus aurantiacus TaxID=446786 RepID=A0ABP7E448_9ACTN
MSKPDLMPLAEEERADLLALLRELTPAQWEAQSLCTEWRIRDVATHVVSYDELSKAATVATFVRGGLRIGKVNDIALSRYRGLDPAGIIDLVARNQRPNGLPSGFMGGIALTDGTIHHQDIRRALGLPRVIPEHRLVSVLSFWLGAPTLPSKGNAKGLRLVATDVDWTAGDGPEVTGPGEAILMAAAGRTEALDDLSGDGLVMLRKRVGRR